MPETVLARELFPVTETWSYCDHASVGPLPRPTRDALAMIFDGQMRRGKSAMLEVEAQREAVRAQVAAAINASPREICFMLSTSDGALLASQGLTWKPDDEIIFADDEFGANAYPWLNLREQGVRCVLVRTPAQRLSPELLERLATKRTRLVAISQVGFSDGYRNDIEGIGRWCEEHDVLFAVDAMQGFGYLPLDVRACKASFAYFAGAKWLLAPHGVSVAYVRADLIERLRPVRSSWRSVVDPMDFLNYDQPLSPDARRFEGATTNYPGIVALGVSLGLLTGAGLTNIERHVLALTDRLIAGARAAGIAVKSDVHPHARSGIVLLDRGGRDVDTLAARFEAAKVGVTVRPMGVRVSPHGYNSESDIDRVLDVLRS